MLRSFLPSTLAILFVLVGCATTAEQESTDKASSTVVDSTTAAAPVRYFLVSRDQPEAIPVPDDKISTLFSDQQRRDTSALLTNNAKETLEPSGNLVAGKPVAQERIECKVANVAGNLYNWVSFPSRKLGCVVLTVATGLAAREVPSSFGFGTTAIFASGCLVSLDRGVGLSLELDKQIGAAIRDGVLQCSGR